MQIYRDLLFFFFGQSLCSKDGEFQTIFRKHISNDQAKNSSLHVQNVVIYVHFGLVIFFSP